eukprot:g4955.t1
MPVDAAAIFKEFDTDGSGQIDAAELGDALRAANVEVTADQVKKLMSVIDTDVSLSEFRAFVGASEVLSKDEVVNKMKATFINQLKQASAPEDIALTVLSNDVEINSEHLQVHKNKGIIRGIKFHALVVKILGYLIVGLSVAAVVAWIYGLT